MNIFSDIIDAIRGDGRAMVATIIRASGSTPAAEDAMMLVRCVAPFRATGSIGGGCLDESILWSVKEDPARTRPRFFTFTLNDDSGDTGLTCGGTIDVLLEPLDSDALPVYEALRDAETRGEDRILAMCLPADGVIERALFNAAGACVAGAIADDTVRGMIADHARAGGEDPERFTVGTTESVVRFFTAPPEVVVFGGGHIGKRVVQFASMAGFRVTLVDDRAAYASRERSPEAHCIVCAPFAEAVERAAINPKSFVVIVTRGHKHDERLLGQVIARAPRYIGMIGSRRKVGVTFANLREHGVAQQDLERVHAPVGVDIGARTPDEIALSIVAELIRERRVAQRIPRAGRSLMQ